MDGNYSGLAVFDTSGTFIEFFTIYILDFHLKDHLLNITGLTPIKVLNENECDEYNFEQVVDYIIAICSDYLRIIWSK